MATSLFLAKVMGLFFVVIGLFILVRHKLLTEMMRILVDSRASLFIMAMLTLILGILLVVSHNIWVADWRVVITIFAWLVFITGIIRMFFMDSAKPMVEWWLKHPRFLIMLAVIYLIVGVWLLYKGMVL